MPSSPLPRRLRVALTTLLLVLPACGSNIVEPIDPIPLDFAVARDRWAQTAPAAYQYTLRRSCFCGPDATRGVVIVVRNGTVESRRYADTGADVAPNLASSFPTIDGLFVIILDSFVANPGQTTVTYDAARGIPVTIAILGSPMIADDESFYTTSDFIVR